MIEFDSQNDFKLEQLYRVRSWLEEVIRFEEKELGEISFVFCSDEFLLDLNQRYLEHDTFTDIITFDYTVGSRIHGEIYISTERVADNALEFKVGLEAELRRVMAHGILHLCGYGDKSKEEKIVMRAKEDSALEAYEDSIS